MRLTSELYYKMKRIRMQYERSYPIPFQAQIPLALRDRISNKVLVPKERPCVPELTVLLQCMKDTNFNEARCSQATKNYYACINKNKEAKAALQQHVGAKKHARDFTPQEINQILKRNPQL